MNSLSKLIIESLNTILNELDAYIGKGVASELKSIKSLICKSETAEDFTSKLNAFKRSIWRSRHGKISRTIAL